MSFEEKIYRDEDVDLGVLDNKVVAIIGYGSQARAQGLNLKESGVKVIVGAGEGRSSWNRAEQDGFDVMTIAEATQQSDVVHILLQDPAQPAVYKESIENNLKEGQTLSFAHGFAVLYGAILPPENVDVILFVPNGPGPVVRQKYKDGSGIYGSVGVEQDYTGNALKTALAISKGVGSTRVGVTLLSFQKETEGDNFEEQVLYGGTIQLIRSVYETMVENGYPKSFSYAKAIRSIRSVIDDIDEVGIEEYLTKRASRTCEYAVRGTGPRVINTEVIKEVMKETESGIFAKNWMLEFSQGMPTLNRLRRNHRDSDMESVGKQWREKFGVS